ncbi:MAG: SDR family NAD(P)-dependent oxidoreductase [Ferruginibacter sp.]
MKITNQKILITGGATGIGLGLAGRFLEDNNTIIICGRRAEVLDAAREKFPGLITRVCDLSNAAEREALYTWIAEAHPDLGILINNAGIQQWMGIDDRDFMERALLEMAINMEAPVHLCLLFSRLPGVHTIMNVSSGLAFTPLTKTPVYSATKAFLHSFTLSLRYLLEPKNIRVIELIPPALNTDLGGKGLHDQAPPVSDFIEAVFNQLEAGKLTCTFGFSAAMAAAGPAELQQAFERMNPAR